MRRLGAWVSFMALLLATVVPAGAQYRDSYPPGPYGNDPYRSNPGAIPEGTRFIVVLDDKLDTKKVDRGKKFKAKLAEDLVAPDGSVIPRGKKLKGHVSDVDRGLHARLLLSFDQIETRNGWVPIAATVTGVPGEHGVKQDTGAEGEIERRGVDKKRAITATAVGAGVGAVTGTLAGGSKGAIIGAAAGAGVGLGAGILTDRDLKLDKDTQLELRLDRQVVVPRR